LPIARDLVRRWANEIQSAIEGGKTSGGFMGFGGSSSQLPTQSSYQSQYLAIGLLYELRKNDRMALVKVNNYVSNHDGAMS
jgi:coatomer protein complex subunit gamma